MLMAYQIDDYFGGFVPGWWPKKMEEIKETRCW